MLTKFTFLCDENIHPTVKQFILDTGVKVKSVYDLALNGKSDLEIISTAFKEKMVILTHDSDFGMYIYTQNVPFVGIVYLRPGHFDPGIHIQSLKAVFNHSQNINSPFIIVAENDKKKIKVRIRNF